MQEALRTRQAQEYEDFLLWWAAFFQEDKAFWERADVVAHVNTANAAAIVKAREAHEKRAAKLLAAAPAAAAAATAAKTAADTAAAAAAAATAAAVVAEAAAATAAALSGGRGRGRGRGRGGADGRGRGNPGAASGSSGQAGTSAAAAAAATATQPKTKKPRAGTTPLPTLLQDTDIVDDATVMKQAPFSTPLQFLTRWPRSRSASRPISEGAKAAFKYLDDPGPAFPEGIPFRFPDGFPAEQLKLSSIPEREARWKEVNTLWHELLDLRSKAPPDRVPTRDLFVCHKGKAPAQTDAYNPQLDAKTDHLAIVLVDPMDTARGWDIGRVESIEPRQPDTPEDMNRMCKVQWLIPSNASCKFGQAWPDQWVGWKLRELLKDVHDEETNKLKHVQWLDDVPVHCIMWSTAMKQSNGEAVLQLPSGKKITALALLCTKRIEQAWAHKATMTGRAAEILAHAGAIWEGLPVPTVAEELDTEPA